MAANGQYDSSHYQHSTKCLKTYLYFTVKLRANQALHKLDLKVIPPLFSTELNINMGLIKLILANQLRQSWKLTRCVCLKRC